MSRSSSRLAFDLGASTTRAIVGTWTGDRMDLVEVHRFDTPLVERDGHLFWSLAELEAGLRLALRSAIGHAGTLRSLSVDSWAVDYVRIDRHGRPLGDPHCYRDPRTEGIMASVFETVPASEIYGATGIQFLPFNTLYQVVADLGVADAGTRSEAALHLTIADWFNHRFGGAAVIERSMASSTQMMDARTGQWASFVSRLGIDRATWPPIVDSGTVIGTSPEGIPIIAGCSHDTGAAVAAAPAHGDRDWAFVSCGTWSLLGMELAHPVLTGDARKAGFTNEAGLDHTVRFLKNLTGLWTLQECAREWMEAARPPSADARNVFDWTALESAAEAAGPAPGTIDLEDPVFTARGDMEARLRRVIREAGLPDPPSRGHLARLVLESIAASYAHALRDAGRLTGRRPSTLYLFGGGSRNALLCRLAADACGLPVVAGPEEATALGNLLIQARTTGDLPSRMTVREAAARSSRVVRYDPS